MAVRAIFITCSLGPVPVLMSRKARMCSPYLRYLLPRPSAMLHLCTQPGGREGLESQYRQRWWWRPASPDARVSCVRYLLPRWGWGEGVSGGGRGTAFCTVNLLGHDSPLLGLPLRQMCHAKRAAEWLERTRRREQWTDLAMACSSGVSLLAPRWCISLAGWARRDGK